MIYNITKWIGLLLTLSFLIVYFKGGFDIINDIRQSLKSTKSIIGSLLLSIMTLIGVVIIYAEVMICFRKISVFSWIQKDLVAFTGILFLFLSMSTALYIRFFYLKDKWSANVNLINENEIVSVGPYKYVRHPLYSIALLLYSGIFFVFASWLMLIYCSLMIVGYILLSYYEDHFLAKNLRNYKTYQKEIPYLLIPYLL